MKIPHFLNCTDTEKPPLSPAPKSEQFQVLTNVTDDLLKWLDDGNNVQFDRLSAIERDAAAVLISARKAEAHLNSQGIVLVTAHHPGWLRRLLTFGIAA